MGPTHWRSAISIPEKVIVIKKELGNSGTGTLFLLSFQNLNIEVSTRRLRVNFRISRDKELETLKIAQASNKVRRVSKTSGRWCIHALNPISGIAPQCHQLGNALVQIISDNFERFFLASVNAGQVRRHIKAQLFF